MSINGLKGIKKLSFSSGSSIDCTPNCVMSPKCQTIEQSELANAFTTIDWVGLTSPASPTKQ